MDYTQYLYMPQIRLDEDCSHTFVYIQVKTQGIWQILNELTDIVNLYLV